MQSSSTKETESLCYEKVSLKEVKLSTTQQHACKKATEDCVHIEANPSYMTVKHEESIEDP